MVLVPGGGFAGPTAQPAAVGTPDMLGYDAKAIARWDVVPFQTFTGDFHIGVVAFHMNGIDRVDFSVNGGPWASVYEMQLNPDTDVWEYTALLRAEDFADGPVEVRAIAWPSGAGEPRVLGGAMSSASVLSGEHSMFLSANAHGSLASMVVYASPSGNDSTGNGTLQSPVRSIFKASQILGVMGGADGGTILLAAGDYDWARPNGTYPAVTTSRWLTVQPMDGVDRAQVRITQPSGSQNSGILTKLVCLRDVTIRASLVTSTPLEDYLWMDGVHVEGQGQLDPCIYLSPGWWTATYATNSVSTNVINGFQNTFVRNSVVDTVHNDAFPGVVTLINNTVRNQVGGTNAQGNAYHTDIWQERAGLTHENVILYGNTATENCIGQGVFTRGSPHNGIAMVNNAFMLRGYPNQSQIISRVQHLLIANNSFLGTPVTIGLSDTNSSVEPYAGSRNALFSHNVFQWLNISDPQNNFSRPFSESTFGDGTRFVGNHFINAWPDYTGSSGVPFGAVIIGTDPSVGTVVPPGRGAWQPAGGGQGSGGAQGSAAGG